jgi:hypothetical protein
MTRIRILSEDVANRIAAGEIMQGVANSLGGRSFSSDIAGLRRKGGFSP